MLSKIDVLTYHKILILKTQNIFRTFKKRRRRKRSLVGRKLRSFVQNVKRYACIQIIYHSTLYLLCTMTDISFNFRNTQRVWRVVLRRTGNYAKTSFGKRSRYINSNRSHFRSNSYIQNLKRYVHLVWFKYLHNHSIST